MKLPMSMFKFNPEAKIAKSCNFVVTFGLCEFAFQSISGMEMDEEFRYINEGGRNGYPIRLRQPRSSPHKITFKRAVPMSDRGIIGLAVDILQEKLFLRRKMPGFIFVIDVDREVKAIYSFMSEGIVEHQVSDFDAMNSEVLIETMTITHRGLHRVPVPPTLF